MTNDELSPPPAAAEPDAADMLRDMFGSPRALVDALSGPLLFALVNAKWGLAPAAIVAGGGSAILALYRLARKQKARQAIFGLVGSLIALGIALMTKSASAYFVPGTVIGAVSGLVTLLTAVFRYPITAVAAQAIQGHPPEWYRRKDVRASHTVLTVAWGLILLARAAYRAYLISNERTVALGFASVILGYPLTAAFLLASIGFLKMRGHGGRLRAEEVVSGAPAVAEPAPSEPHEDDRQP